MVLHPSILMLRFGSFNYPGNHRWKPKVRTISSANGVGIEQLWSDACVFRERGVAGIKDMRGRQRGYAEQLYTHRQIVTLCCRYWMWQEACGMLERSLKTSLPVQKLAQELQVGFAALEVVRGVERVMM